jgi:uncharacterized protein YdaU (DUF1376 family)
MAALPYMPLYVADYLGDAAHLTTIQHGAYLLLIMNYWQRGSPLPDDDAKLARIVRMSTRDWARNRAVLAEFFASDGTNWVHQRIDRELAHVAAKSLKSKKAAQASVQRRFGERSADVERALNHTDTDTETRKERKKVTAPKSAAPLVFEGRIVRLTKGDFDQWQRAYPDIDLPAVLQARDDWLVQDADDATRKKWFLTTSNHLANLQQKATTTRREATTYDRDRITV